MHRRAADHPAAPADHRPPRPPRHPRSTRLPGDQRAVAVPRRRAVPVAAPPSHDAAVLSPRDWTVVTATAPGAEALLDGDGSTVWSQPAPTTTPASVTLDMGKTQTVAGFSLTPWRHPDKVSAPPRGYTPKPAPTARPGPRRRRANSRTSPTPSRRSAFRSPPPRPSATCASPSPRPRSRRKSWRSPTWAHSRANPAHANPTHPVTPDSFRGPPGRKGVV